MVVHHSFRLSTLSSEAPAHFDECEVAGYLVKGVKLKSKNNTRMPRKLWKTGLEHGLSRITKESLLEQLTGQQKDLWVFEMTAKEPIEKESIKARSLPNQVAWYVGWHREAPLEQRFPMRGELYAGHGWFWRRVVWYLCYEDSQCCTDVGLGQLRVYGRWPYRFSLIYIQTDKQFWFK